MGVDGLRVLTCIVAADDTQLPPKVDFGAQVDFCSRVLPDSRLRSAAAAGIGSVNPLAPGAEESLRKAVQVLLVGCDDPIAIVRSSCTAALAKLSRGSREQIPYLRVRCLHPRIYRAMRDVDEVVRMVAAESLAKAGPEGELLLVEAVQRDTIPIVRAAAVHGLMRVGRTTMRSIVGALCDPEAVVRDAAGLALRSIPRRALLRGVKEMPNHQIVITLKAVKNARGLFTNNGDHVLDLLEWLVARLSERHKIIFCKH